jgi:hypothetical protein
MLSDRRTARHHKATVKGGPVDVMNTKLTIDSTTREKESSLSGSYKYHYTSSILTRGNQRG